MTAEEVVKAAEIIKRIRKIREDIAALSRAQSMEDPYIDMLDAPSKRLGYMVQGIRGEEPAFDLIQRLLIEHARHVVSDLFMEASRLGVDMSGEEGEP